MSDPETGGLLQRAAVQALSGGMAGAATVVVTCPLDNIKTRLQLNPEQHGNRYKGLVGTARTMAVEEGLRGFYRGGYITTLALIPNWAVYFLAYHEGKHVVRHLVAGRFDRDGPVVHTLGAMIGGAITNVTTAPLWMVKTRMQTQHVRRTPYAGIAEAFARIVRREGPRSLWNGSTAQLFGLVHVMVQFPVYEALKKASRARRRLDADSPLPMVDVGVCAAIAKCAGSAAAYPHEVLRVRLMHQRPWDPVRYASLREGITRIYSEEGIGGYYRGLGTNLCRVIPASVITFLVFEACFARLQQVLPNHT